MPILIFIGLMLALWAFIVWERRRPVAPLSREAMSLGWALSAYARWPVYAGLSFVGALLGLVKWFNPSHPPFAGRLSSLRAVAYAYFGPHGIAYLWWAIAALLVLLSLISWHASSSRSRRGSGSTER